jgi:hypothetical protein
MTTEPTSTVEHGIEHESKRAYELARAVQENRPSVREEVENYLYACSIDYDDQTLDAVIDAVRTLEAEDLR